MNKLLIGVFALVLIAVGAYFAFKDAPVPEEEIETATSSSPIIEPEDNPFSGRQTQLFNEPELSVSFHYPSDADGYTLVDTSEQTGGMGEFMKFISLYQTEEWEEFQNATSPREGPPSISLMVVPVGTFDSPETWVKGSELSNFQLSGTEVGHTTVNGLKAYRYRYDGLYQAEATALVANSNAYVLTVSYNDEEDSIYADYEAMLETLEIRVR